jgi:pimeloyl-[acyl-carrier protein] methyl ester esterase
MNLYLESYGEGAPLLLIHGWGMHGGIWGDAVSQLARHFRVHCVDLPGHGASIMHPSPYTLDAVVEALSARFDEPLAVCGWSFGGQVALRWARLAPQQVQRLVLVASTPCFVEREDWVFGMEQANLRQFAEDLERNPAVALRRFLALQVHGSEWERELLAGLRSRLFSRGEPDVNALRGGLEILGDADLRAELPTIRQPVLAIAGERDRLVPPEASFYLAQTLPDARVEEIAGAAHVPFLSHPEFFVRRVTDFLHE